MEGRKNLRTVIDGGAPSEAPVSQCFVEESSKLPSDHNQTHRLTIVNSAMGTLPIRSRTAGGSISRERPDRGLSDRSSFLAFNSLK
ncbi:hypothetical protein KIN20_001625 [Parelaphostrongylus tenuis]|uniref:Uncharacterized protein n=1 Tax=Parelaphostrongylus tenuis TaxID=148309 RepID=A0AAD5LYL1_PARTN|nr:hypothetical protein KIN20_001625 [Parelaphostrongylus tenuis]